MKKINIADFQFSSSFIFFKKTKKLKKKTIRVILKSIIRKDEMIYQEMIRWKTNPFSTKNLISASIIIGKIKNPTKFSCGTLEDDVIAYILLLERHDYIAVQLRNITTEELHPFSPYMEKLQYQDLSRVVERNCLIKKMSSKIINPMRRGLSGKSYEGYNLEYEMPTFTNNRSIPRGIKSEHMGDTTTISTPTSRITRYSRSSSIDKVSDWVDAIFEKLSNAPLNPFISTFVQPADFQKSMESLKLKIVQFDTEAIKEYFQTKNLNIYVSYKSKKKTYKATATINTLLARTFLNNSIQKVEKNQEITSGEIITTKTKLQIKINKNSNIKITTPDGKAISLNSIINNQNFYSVYFNKINSVFYAGGLYSIQDSNLDINSIKSILRPIPALKSADREKVKLNNQDKNNYSNLIEFPSASVFYIIEKALGEKYNYILCDDLGDEWADHILISKVDKKLTFIHSKHGAITGGASPLHEVVAQAMKNLGRMYSPPNQYAQKVSLMLAKKSYAGTNIDIIRKKPRKISKKNMPQDIENILSHPNIEREMAISCSFISEAKIIADLNSIANGAQPPHVNQLFWLLSSFIAASKELNVTPAIYCQP